MRSAALLSQTFNRPWLTRTGSTDSAPDRRIRTQVGTGVPRKRVSKRFDRVAATPR